MMPSPLSPPPPSGIRSTDTFMYMYIQQASLSHSIVLLGQQIENLDRTSTSRLNGIHKLLLANHNQLLKSNELLRVIHNAELVSARANKRNLPVTPGAPNSKRVSSRPPLGTAYREQYGQ